MKQQLAAIAYNEKELDAYVSYLLQTLQFEVVSEVKKAEDGSYYQVLAKAARADASQAAVPAKAMSATPAVQEA